MVFSGAASTLLSYIPGATTLVGLTAGLPPSVTYLILRAVVDYLGRRGRTNQPLTEAEMKAAVTAGIREAQRIRTRLTRPRAADDSGAAPEKSGLPEKPRSSEKRGRSRSRRSRRSSHRTRRSRRSSHRTRRSRRERRSRRRSRSYSSRDWRYLQQLKALSTVSAGADRA
eukprot:tig00000492_g1509.t1